MTPGFWIAVGCWGVIVIGVCIGFGYDLAHWRQDRRAIKRLDEVVERDRLRAGLAWCEAWASQLEEIKELPEAPEVVR